MVLLSASSVGAQTSNRLDAVRVSAASVDSAFRSIARTPADVARELPGVPDQYQVIVLSRQTAGVAEIHERWTDIVFVRRGSGILQTGAVLVGSKRSEPSEWTGSAIENPKDRRVSAGDFLLIPAGLAHQWRPTGRGVFSYVVVKVRPNPAAP